MKREKDEGRKTENGEVSTGQTADKETTGEKRDYVKTALYVYPVLRAAAKELGEHVKRKAYLSYASKTSCQNLAEYLLEQLDAKTRLETLYAEMKKAMHKLSDGEKTLLFVRYFGVRKTSGYTDEQLKSVCGSRRTYYRKQDKLKRKIGERLKRAGLSEERFYREYGGIELIRRVDDALQKGRRGAQGAREERIVASLGK